MKFNNKKIGFCFALLLLLVTLTSCGCGGCSGEKTMTYSEAATKVKASQISMIQSCLMDITSTTSITEAKKNQVNEVVSNEFDGKNLDETITKCLNMVKEELNATDEQLAAHKTYIYEKQLQAAKDTAIANLGNFYAVNDLDRHQIELCNNEKAKFVELIGNAENAIQDVKETEKVEDTKNVYQLLSNYYLSTNALKVQMSPIRIYSFKEDGFFNALFNNVLVFPVGWLMQAISSLFGGYYIIGLFIVTILIRTLMMPVYNSTNNMSLKMQLMQPELQKLEAKYQNRKDPDSERAKQMEQMQLYKKYKMGFGGCFSMILQFPVFMAVYQAVSRMYLTDGKILNSPDWVSKLNTKFLGLDLFLTRGETWSGQFWGVMIILVLVVGSQFLQQQLTTLFQKKNYEKSQENIPAYKRQAMQQNQMNGSMKFMMYFMIVMMGMFVFQSAAGLGMYWLIGNIYSLVQMLLNHKFADRKLERLKKKLKLGE